MASLPPLVVANTVKLDPDFKKLSAPSLSFEKKNYSTKELNSLGSESKQALSLTSEGNGKFESSHYLLLLQECMQKVSVSGVESVHAHIIKSGFDEQLYVMTNLVNVYGKCGRVGTAHKVFDDLPVRNAVAWTSLMSGYISDSRPEVAVSVFCDMLEAEAYPTNYTMGLLLNACTTLCDFDLAKQIHGFIVKYDLAGDASIGNALCSLYSKCHNLGMAIKAFERIEEKNVISWTAVISACGVDGKSALGMDMFVKMLLAGVEPNETTLTSVLNLCCTMHALKAGSQVHSLIIKLGYGSDLPLTNSIMYLYLRSGCIREAKRLFDGMSSVNLVTWNTMIAGYAEMINLKEDGLSAYSCGIEALQIFQQMNRSGLKPDLYTFSSLLSVCSSLVALEQGEQVHALTIKNGFMSDVIVGTALLNMYNKCGSINRATKAFLEMSQRTLISWTSMITALAQHGRSELALQVFEDMRFVGVKPNKITFVGVLSACSQAGMVDRAFAYYDMMKNEYKINPVIHHYACLIDMFVRLDKIDEAFEFIKKKDLTPNEFIWSILIAGCRSRGKLELAFHAAEQLLDLEPKDSETYLLLLDMYISAGRWANVSRVRKMMRGVDKKMDWSWISIRNKVHSFKFSNKKHHSHKVVKLLDDLIDRAKPLGYKAETDMEVDDEEKEETTTSAAQHHSEKLAVAFGLINTSREVQIRVTKNIGMCRDCHNFIKLVSVLTSRTIIIRDSKRLHKFYNGQCSCKDFGGLV